MREERKAKL